MNKVGAEYGLLVSWSGFKSSVEQERGNQFFKIRLWDANDVIDELFNNYDKLMLEENPNLLETEKYITLHDLLGRDLYKDKQLIPIKGEEIVTLAEKHNQNSAQM